MKTSGRTNSTPGKPNLHRAGPEGGKNHIKRGAKGGAKGLSLSLSFFFPHTGSRLWVGVPSRLEDGFSCYFLNKIEV